MSDPAYAFTVEPGHAALYARAVGDIDAGYPEQSGDLVIPPTFLSASVLFDPASPGRHRPAPTQPSAGGGMAAEAHFEYHRLPRPGETLTVRRRQGDSWRKEGKRGGTLSFVESVTEYRDAADQLVCSIRRVAVRTERAVGAE